MYNENIEQRIIGVFGKYSGNKDLQSKQFTLGTDMVVFLGLDSLDIAEVCMSFEDEFGVCFEEFIQTEQKFSVMSVLRYVTTHKVKV